MRVKNITLDEILNINGTLSDPGQIVFVPDDIFNNYQQYYLDLEAEMKITFEAGDSGFQAPIEIYEIQTHSVPGAQAVPQGEEMLTQAGDQHFRAETVVEAKGNWQGVQQDSAGLPTDSKVKIGDQPAPTVFSTVSGRNGGITDIDGNQPAGENPGNISSVDVPQS